VTLEILSPPKRVMMAAKEAYLEGMGLENLLSIGPDFGVGRIINPLANN
jgi:hypothetical protein